MSALLALLAVATPAAAPEAYRALGAAPLWNARIGDGRMVFETWGGPVVRAPLPGRQETELGFVHWTRDFAISVEHANCTDPLTRRIYADRVMVRVSEREYEGCGGRVLSPALPRPYAAGGNTPLWRVEIAHGRLTWQIDNRATVLPEPASRSTRNGSLRVYETRALSVAIRREHCESDDGRAFADTVTVRAGRRILRGCGGTVVRDAPEE